MSKQPRRWYYWAISVFGLLLLTAAVHPTHTYAQSASQLSAADLKTAVAQAQPGDTLHIYGGTFHGNLLIDKTLTLIGHDWPIIDGGQQGTVVQINAPDTQISGFLIRNSGSSLDEENAGLAVAAANGQVVNNRFAETLFGIYLREAHGTLIQGNEIHSKALDVPRRGDPIRVWFSNDVTISDNQISAGRDVVLWYSERLTVRNNLVQNGRYGLHFMYCDDATVSQNQLLYNSVGAFMMYSRRVTLMQNVIAYNRGPSGYGIGLKDMDDAIVQENIFLDNRVGAHLDTSPREVNSIGQFSGNLFAYNDIGVDLMPSVRHNEFAGNSFIDNLEQVVANSRSQWQANSWTVGQQGNYWSDYAGFDANGDGSGDISYKSERLFETLTQRQPALRLFLFSPAADALDFAARAFPLVRPQPTLEDSQPMMQVQFPDNLPPLPKTADQRWYLVALTLALLAVGCIRLARWQRQPYQFPRLQQEAS